MNENERITIFGPGKVAKELVEGFLWMRHKPSDITVVGRDPKKLEYFEEKGVTVSTTAHDHVADTNVILTVRPEGAGPTLAKIASTEEGPRNVISFVSGLTITQIHDALGVHQRNITRGTLNTNVSSAHGIIALAGLQQRGPVRAYDEMARLLGILGTVYFVEQREVAKLIGIVGSGNAIDGKAIVLLSGGMNGQELAKWLGNIQIAGIKNKLAESFPSVAAYLAAKTEVFTRQFGYTPEKAHQWAMDTFMSTVDALCARPDTDALIASVITEGGCTEKGIFKLDNPFLLFDAKELGKIFMAIHRRAIQFPKDVRNSFEVGWEKKYRPIIVSRK